MQEISFVRYVGSSSFMVDLVENWQSEYLQFTLYILITVWLVQRGSPESKEIGKEGGESDQDQKLGKGGVRDFQRMDPVHLAGKFITQSVRRIRHWELHLIRRRKKRRDTAPP